MVGRDVVPARQKTRHLELGNLIEAVRGELSPTPTDIDSLGKVSDRHF
jgi:hypothetical protein